MQSRERGGAVYFTKWEHVYLDQAARLPEQSKVGEQLIFLPELPVSCLPAAGALPPLRPAV